MDEAVPLLLRAVGVFYLAGGAMVGRAVRFGAATDRMAEALGLSTSRAERIRTWWLAAGAVTTAASGLALVMLAEAAAWLFAFATLQQALYLFVVSPRWLDPDDPPEAEGRRQSTRAFVMFAVATVLVAAAAHDGHLADWRALPGWLAGFCAFGFLAWSVHLVWSVARRGA
ncbi:hypothetical protein [Prosthecomicrobium sp. N25]|uniref:hypothetical protein n=1 Tax=Prosthecomicrobium sp. N25 TaxID=3129254 RepID=UPI0030774F6C